MTDYLLVSADEVRIEHFVRQTNDRWLLSETTEVDEVLAIESIGCSLKVMELYDRVEFV